MAGDDSTSETDETTSDTGGQDSATETDRQPDVPPAVKAALRKANKEAETLRLKLKEYEDKDKTESQRLQDAITVAEKRAVDAEQELLRIQVGAGKGLTVAQARRLVGSTREELEADAADLLESFGGGGKAGDAAAGDAGKPDTGDKGAGASARRPKEALRPGAAPADTGDKPDPKKIAADILASPF